VNPRYSLPGDTPELVAALHALTKAGMRPPNRIDPGARTAACPRCGRMTVIGWRYRPPTVCTGCRAEWMANAAQES
jgi:hypothetical protein